MTNDADLLVALTMLGDPNMRPPKHERVPQANGKETVRVTYSDGERSVVLSLYNADVETAD